MTKRDAMLLADRQRRVVDDLIAKMRRGLDQLTTEYKGEERLTRLLGLVGKAQGMSPSAEQSERMWAIVEQAQLRMEELVPSVRMRYSDEAADTLDSKSLGLGYEV